MSEYCRVEDNVVIRNSDGQILGTCYDHNHAEKTASKLNFWNTQGWSIEWE